MGANQTELSDGSQSQEQVQCRAGQNLSNLRCFFTRARCRWQRIWIFEKPACLRRRNLVSLLAFAIIVLPSCLPPTAATASIVATGRPPSSRIAGWKLPSIHNPQPAAGHSRPIPWQQQTTTHPHKVLALPCETCHVATSFKDIRFDHDTTDYPLQGRHQGVACLSCHNVENFGEVTESCVSCHQDVHQAKMGNDCVRCHSSDAWLIFDAEEIHAQTRFPLIGRHVLVDCQRCHPGMPEGDFALNTISCERCHQQQFLNAQSPNHVANGFSTDCESCHQMFGWRPAFLPDHDALFFPIYSGTHNNTWDDCTSCHPEAGNQRVFSCITCHEHEQSRMHAEHNGITGYVFNSANCLQCHPTGKKGEFRDHDAQFFPIFSGTHNNRWDNCVACHTDPGNRNIFSCITCHEHEQVRMDPEHNGITGYVFDSANCLQCHPTGEKGEFRDHDAQFFPIYSGAHRNRWESCATCHNVAGNNKLFTCIVCHEHDQQRMDDEHRGEVDNYRYDSIACYECHPNGRGD